MIQETELSRRELQVLKLAAKGATDNEISEQLAISVPTLRTYWLRIRDKVGATNRTHAIAIAVAGALGNTQTDPIRRIFDRARTERIAEWILRPNVRTAYLDPLAKQLFGIASEDPSVPIERLLSSVWAPDRPRLERYLQQASEVAPLTPIDLHVATTNQTQRIVRTVNLTTHRTRNEGTVILFASVLARAEASA